jgi:hypothetical protein
VDPRDEEMTPGETPVTIDSSWRVPAPRLGQFSGQLPARSRPRVSQLLCGGGRDRSSHDLAPLVDAKLRVKLSP